MAGRIGLIRKRLSILFCCSVVQKTLSSCRFSPHKLLPLAQYTQRARPSAWCSAHAQWPLTPWELRTGALLPGTEEKAAPRGRRCSSPARRRVQTQGSDLPLGAGALCWALCQVTGAMNSFNPPKSPLRCVPSLPPFHQ